MTTHIALYKWKASAKPEDIAAALSGIASLANLVEGITEITCARNTSRYSEGHTHVILVRGNDKTALDAYRTHPLHQKLATDIEAMEQHGIGVDFNS